MEALRITPEFVVQLARELHTELGHRLREEAYLAALALELEQRGASVERQRALELRNGDELLDLGFVADLLVDSSLVVRLCALHHLDPGNEAWVLERLALPGPRSGVYLDFLRSELDVLTVPYRGA